MSDYRSRLKQDFSKASQSYGELSTIQQQNYLYAYEYLAAQSSDSLRVTLPHARAIDIGVGSGVGLNGLLHAFPELADLKWHMCDLSFGMLEANQLSFPKVTADAALLPWANHSFHFTISNFALHWCDNLQAALSELVRITNQDGSILVSLPVNGSFSILEKAWSSQELHSPLHQMPQESVLLQYLDKLELSSYARRRTLCLDLKTPQACFELLKKTGVRRKNGAENRMTKGQYKGIVKSLSEQLANGQALSFEMMDIIINK